MTERFLEAPQHQTVLEERYVGRFLKNDTTPDVHDVEHWICANPTATLITHFEKGQEGQHLYILGDGVTTLQFNTHILTASGSDLLLNAGTLYHFLGLGTPVVWHQQNDTGAGGGSGGVASVFGRVGHVVALQADYDAFFLTPAEGNALYSPLGHTHDFGLAVNALLEAERGGDEPWVIPGPAGPQGATGAPGAPGGGGGGSTVYQLLTEEATEQWGYPNGPAVAVAPVNQTVQLLMPWEEPSEPWMYPNGPAPAAAAGGGGGVSGAGTIGTIPKWTGASALGDSFFREVTTGLIFQAGGDTTGLTFVRGAADNYQIRSNDDGTGAQQDAAKVSWAAAWGEGSDRFAIFRRAAAGAYLAMADFDAAGGFSVYQGTASEANSNQKIRLYGSTNARIQVFPVGASGEPWQIDNLAGELRFFTPGFVHWTISTGKHLVPGSDVTKDIGATALRVRDFFVTRISDGAVAAGTLLSSSGATLRLGLGTGWTQTDFHSGGTARWSIVSAGHLVPFADNTYDIGSTALQLRDIHIEGEVVAENGVNGKTADQATFANALTDITGTSWVVGANERWEFEIFIPYTTNATAGTVGWTVNGPAGTTVSYQVFGTTTAITAYSTTFSAVLNVGVGALGTLVSSTNHFVVIRGRLTTVGTAGTAIARGITSAAGKTVIAKNGTWVKARRVV